MIASVLGFFVVLLSLYPTRELNSVVTLKSGKKTEMNLLMELRSTIQIQIPPLDEFSNSIYTKQLEEYVRLNKEFGIRLVPLVDYLISCEQDRQKLIRELDTRCSTAIGASTTLFYMPSLMWLIGLALGIDIFGFLTTVAGLAVLGLGVLLTLISRLAISRTKAQAMHFPRYKKIFELKPLNAALITLAAICLFGSSYPSFVVGVMTAILVKEFWNKIPQNNELRLANLRQEKTETLTILALLIESGLPWPTALQTLNSQELSGISRRIEMGQSPALAFMQSTHWQDVGELIAKSMIHGTSIAPDLLRLSDEYRRGVLSYRIQRIERFAGRLIIPVNLLQIPAFILVGVVPMIAPMIMQTLEGFHIYL